MFNAGLAFTLIVVGVIGVVWHLRLLPSVESVVGWLLVWAGLFILIKGWITKGSFVVGLMLILAGVGVYLHDLDGLSWWLLVSFLLIALGALILIARHPRIPEHRPQP